MASTEFPLHLSQKIEKASTRWHAPNINYPKQKRFCQTKEDFHEEYGLSLEGENPRYLSDAGVPEDQWLTVFTHKHANNEKVHLKSLRSEFYEECALLYHMVYQRIPPNNEITVKFARGFVFEKYRLLQSPTKKAKHKVAWAVFAESVIKNVSSQKKLLTKMALWRDKNGPFNASTVSHLKQDNLAVSRGGSLLSAECPCSQHDKAYFIQPNSLRHSDLVNGMVSVANKKLKEKESLVVDCKVSIDEARTKRDKAKGVRGAADALLQKIKKSKEELQVLEGEGEEAAIWRLKAEILGCQVALDLLGPDVQSSTLEQAVDESQDRHILLLKEVEEANAHVCFVNELVKQLERRQIPTLTPAPPVARHSVKGSLVIQDECVACGMSIDGNDVVGIYMLPCKHPYHPLCFATMCHTREECAQIGCSQSIPCSARQLVLGCPGKLLEQHMLKDALCEAKVGIHRAKTSCSRKKGYKGRDKSHIGSSRQIVAPRSTVDITMGGDGLMGIRGICEGYTFDSRCGAVGGKDQRGEDENVADTFDSHDEGQGDEGLNGEDKKMGLQVETRHFVEGTLSSAIDCHVAELTEHNVKENILQCTDGAHEKYNDVSLHMTLNRTTNVGTKKRKAAKTEKASKKSQVPTITLE